MSIHMIRIRPKKKITTADMDARSKNVEEYHTIILSPFVLISKTFKM